MCRVFPYDTKSSWTAVEAFQAGTIVVTSFRRSTSSTAPRRATLALAALLSLGACSSVPDWANPVAWYDGVFGEDETAPQPAPRSAASAEGRARTENAEQQPPPRAGSVPERPRATSTREERTQVASGLAADREAARYTDEDLRGRPAAPAFSEPAPVARPAAPPPAPVPAPAARQVAAVPVAPPQPQAVPAPAPIPTPQPLTQMPSPQPLQQAAISAPAPTMPPAPMPGIVAPIRDSSALDQSYRSALMASAATVTTAPANTGFQPARPAAIATPATTVPGNVMQTYQQPPLPPVALPATPTAAVPLAPIAARGLPGPNAPGTFANAGSRLAAQIPFGAGSTGLGRRDLETVSTVLAEHNTRGGTIRVIGFSPAGNSAQSKLNAFRLAQERASAVASALTREGARANFVFVEARTDMAGEPANRVDLYLEN